MKIIILGAGQVGRTAAYHLAREAGERSHGRRHQGRAAARPAGSHRHPHGRRQRDAARHPRSRRRARGRHLHRADQQRRSEHDGVPDRLEPVQQGRDAHRAHPLRRFHQASQAVLRRGSRLRRRRADQPGAARHRSRRAPDPVSRRAAGAGLRRRPRAPGRREGATRRRARRPAAQATARATSRATMRASPRSIATARASSRPATRSSSMATRCSSSPRARTSGWS